MLSEYINQVKKTQHINFSIFLSMFILHSDEEKDVISWGCLS